MKKKLDVLLADNEWLKQNLSNCYKYVCIPSGKKLIVDVEKLIELTKYYSLYEKDIENVWEKNVSNMPIERNYN